MWTSLRKLLVPVFALTLAGTAFASAQVPDGERLDVGTESSEDGTTQALDVGDDGAFEVRRSEDEADPTGSSKTTPTFRSTEGCPEGFSGNHGQFVSSTEDRPRRDAAHSPCGKPTHVVDAGDDVEDADADEGAEDDGEQGHKHGNGNGNSNHENDD